MTPVELMQRISSGDPSGDDMDALAMQRPAADDALVVGSPVKPGKKET